MIKNLFTAFYADEKILCFNEGSDDVAFNCNEMGIFNIAINNNNLDNNFNEYDPVTVIFIRLLA